MQQASVKIFLFAFIHYLSKVWVSELKTHSRNIEMKYKEMKDFFQQGCIKLIKSGSKDIYVIKDFYFK